MAFLWSSYVLPFRPEVKLCINIFDAVLVATWDTSDTRNPGLFSVLSTAGRAAKTSHVAVNAVTVLVVDMAPCPTVQHASAASSLLNALVVCWPIFFLSCHLFPLAANSQMIFDLFSEEVPTRVPTRTQHQQRERDRALQHRQGDHVRDWVHLQVLWQGEQGTGFELVFCQQHNTAGFSNLVRVDLNQMLEKRDCTLQHHDGNNL